MLKYMKNFVVVENEGAGGLYKLMSETTLRVIIAF